MAKKNDRFANLLFLFLFVFIIFSFFFALKNPILLYASNPTIEINENYDPKTNIQQVFFHSNSDVQIKGTVNTKKVGNYKVTYQLNTYKRVCTISVKDTKAPILKVHDYKTDFNEKVQPESFVKSVKDDSKVTLSFQNKITKDKKQIVTIVAQDTSGNYTMKDANLTLVKDTQSPKIQTKNFTIYKNSNPKFKTYIHVSDNLDTKPKVKIDASEVNTKKEGTYKLYVTATDRSKNTSKKTIKVTVKKPDKVVYLTFDDGPSENTEKVLKILKKYNAKATFFVTGNNQKYNSSIKKAYDQGNTIGLHTYTHDYKTIYVSTQAYFDDLNKVRDMVKNITGESPKYIRFPGGSSNMVSANYSVGIMSQLVDMVHEQGYEYFDWNCSSADAASNTVDKQTIINNATSCNEDQIMILFHDSSPKTTTVEALSDVIQTYQKRGYVFEGISKDTPEFHHGTNN